MMKKYTGWLVVVAAVALILVSAQWQYRVDLTAEQRYTVSNASEQLLQQLKAPVEITVLLGGDDLPSGFRKLAQATDRFWPTVAVSATAI
jgi:ABC-type uncharacterized transport system.